MIIHTFFVTVNNSNQNKKWAFVIGSGRLKQLAQKIPIFGVGCLRQSAQKNEPK
jgi:hypothetical protein